MRIQNLLKVILLLIIGGSITNYSQAQPTSQMIAANQLFESQKWAEAAQAYQKIIDGEPNNGRAWLQLGKSRLSLGQYELAINALEKNVAMSKNSWAMVKIACAYTKLNQKEKALEWLEKAAQNKASATVNLIQESDLESLRNEPRYKEISLTIEKEQKPCMFMAEAKQFDFWIGSWTVFNPQGQKAGESQIIPIASGCGLLENWINTLELPGKSINFFDPKTQKWHQYWIGSDGIPIRFEGNYKEKSMVFEGVSITKDGEKTLYKMTYFLLDENT
ncbi:MAG: tetratricopeptide repeat protein, partial [Pyrinomonadaceae bacterium]|nr:tetratricopeptide repeat protein [Pyrinomonadaceae bacterium]